MSKKKYILANDKTRKQILLRIDNDLYKHIKEVSEAEDKSITLVINEILRFALNKYLEPVESV